jgi:hypothetical protein
MYWKITSGCVLTLTGMVPTRRTVMAQAGSALLATTALAGCGSSDSGGQPAGEDGNMHDSTPTPTPAASHGSEHVDIIDHSGGVTDAGFAAVRGTAKNVTDRRLSYVQIEARYLDSSGTRIGSGLDNVSNLGAGRECAFEATCLDCDTDRVDSYQLEITASF